MKITGPNVQCLIQDISENYYYMYINDISCIYLYFISQLPIRLVRAHLVQWTMTIYWTKCPVSYHAISERMVLLDLVLYMGLYTLMCTGSLISDFCQFDIWYHFYQYSEYIDIHHIKKSWLETWYNWGMTMPGSNLVLVNSHYCMLMFWFMLQNLSLTRNGSFLHTHYQIMWFTANNKQTLFYCAKPCTSVEH